jgi:hypothetical protein
MSLFSEGIAQRAVGHYPLSVATSLALEGLAGIYEDRPESPPPILKYDQMWVNMKTLFRNFMGSLEKSLVDMMDAVEAAEAISEEMERVQDIVKDLNPHCQVMFYVSNYVGMERKYPKAVIRLDTTPRQKIFTATQSDCISALLDKHKDDENIRVFQRMLEYPTVPLPSVVVLTHYAYDLLSANVFKRLDLIESYTGIVKPKALWYTKFYQGRDLVMIPFREDMIQIFGDNETFSPWASGARREIIEIAKASLSFMKDFYLRARILEIITSQ